jgi:hypothetical protein
MNTQYISGKCNPLGTNQVTRITHTLPEATLEGVIYSSHAVSRIKQRGIKTTWITLLLEYGCELYQQGKGTYTYSFDKASIKKIKRIYGNTFSLSKLRSLYLVLSEDNVVITCAYR